LPSSLTTLHFAHRLHYARRVGFRHHSSRSDSSSCCPLDQEPGKNRMGLSLSNMSASCQSERCCPGFCRPFHSLFARSPEPGPGELHYVAPPLSNLRLCYLLHVSWLSNEVCTHRVHIDGYLFTESSTSRRSFPDWATPVQPCSIVVCMLINCRLHQFLSLIHKEFRIPYPVYLVNELKMQVVDVRLCLLAISLATCRHINKNRYSRI